MNPWLIAFLIWCVPGISGAIYLAYVEHQKQKHTGYEVTYGMLFLFVLLAISGGWMVGGTAIYTFFQRNDIFGFIGAGIEGIGNAIGRLGDRVAIKVEKKAKEPF